MDWVQKPQDSRSTRTNKYWCMAYTDFIKTTVVTQTTTSSEISWNLDTSVYNEFTSCSTTEPLTSFSSKSTGLLIFSGWDSSLVPPNNNLDAVFVDAFSVVGQETDAQGMTFNNDGTKMFVCGKVGDDVNEYALSSAFDVSTASYTTKFGVGGDAVGDANKPMGVQFNADGTKMFVLDEVNDRVNEYTLSTGFDLASTVAYIDSFSVAGQEVKPTGFTFNTDGTKMFMCGWKGMDVNEYTLRTGFDIGPAITFVDSFSVNSQEDMPRGLTFNNDGTKMFVAGFTGDDVNEYTLTTGFDVSTASFVDSFDVSSQDSQVRCVKFNTDGTKMFVLGSYNDSVYEYTLTTGFDVSTASYVDSFDISSQEEDSNGLQFNNDGTKMFVVGEENGGDIYEYTLTTGFDVSTASYVDSLDVNSQETFPMGLTFNTDGTKMFVCGWTGDDINEYTLTTGFDISTASFVDRVSVSSQDNKPSSIEFNTDGTKMFVLGATGVDVNEYTLTTGFVISNVTFVDSFSVASQNTDPRDVKFSTDGTVMFIMGRQSTTDSVYRYTLTTGFDVSTATYEDSFYIGDQETAGNSIAFSTDGLKMFVLGTNSEAVNEYTLSTAWDFSPVTTTVDGIEVKILASKRSRIVDSIVQLAQSGSVIGANQATSQINTGNAYTYGDSSLVTPHTWDATLAYGDLSTLQVAVKYTSDDTPHSDTAYVYSVQLKIHYT